MSFLKNKKLKYVAFFLFLFLFVYAEARLGGGGGNSHSSSSSHGGGSGDGLGGIIYLLFRVLGWKGSIVLIIGYFIYQRFLKDKFFGNNTYQQEDSYYNNSSDHNYVKKEFPEGLDKQKVQTAFLEMQEAWKNQDLGSVRKWMTDGLYQKLSIQIAMMKKLEQHNKTENMRIRNIACVNSYSFREFNIADIKIDFVVDDYFYSEKYSSMKESYPNDYGTEYFTFVRKGNVEEHTEANLYSSNNCPNCGALLENKMGEVCRCSSCKTLTNNPKFDWILAEITQENNYNNTENHLNYDEKLLELTQFEDDFLVQSVEDVASNIIMQIIDVITGGNNIKLERFAKKETANEILTLKNSYNNIVFDRLYLNEVTVESYTQKGDNLELEIYAEAVGKRVKPNGNDLTTIDYDVKVFDINLSLTKNILTKKPTSIEAVYSYECSNCGAPYDDTTHDTCNYCGSVVLDESRNWVLNSFKMS